MKKGTSRIIAVLLALILCLCQITAALPVSAATVSYVTGSADGFYGVIRNWGTRGEDADFLSPNAIAFYEDNNTSYRELSQLSGSTSQSSVPSSALYKELQALMKDNHTQLTSYGNIRYLFAFTDCENSSTSTLSEFYLGKTVDSTWDSGVTFNREHCWPKSKTSTPSVNNNTTGEAADIMSQRPADPSTNTSRSNDAYGTSSGYYDPNSSQMYGDDVRGDVARIILYVYVRWGNTDNMWGSTGVMENKTVLLDWMEEDPVDTWEMGRNDSVESITGTRNVFVDYPELAFQLFNEEVPTGYTTPSGETAESYTVTASSNNSSWGTVSVTGNTILATPATGYEVSGYTVLSGSATVTRDGNTFTATPTSDVSIRIDFAPMATYTLTFLENGVTVSTHTAQGSFTMPAYSGTVPEDYSFVGWTTASLEESTTCPETLYEAGESVPVTGDETFYALYAQWEERENSDVFVPHSGEITEGDYLLTCDGGALTATVNSGNRWDYTGITPSEDGISSTNGAIIWHIAKQADGYYTIYNEAAGVYAAGTGAKNKGTLISSITDFAKWTVSGSDTYDFTNLGNSLEGVNAILRRNGTYGFACYSESTGGALTLYKRGAGVAAVYTTRAEASQPAYTVTFLAEDGTVLSSESYLYGATVTPPQAPEKAADESYTYTFAGWTPEVETVTGDATYTATYTATEIEKPVENGIVKQPENTNGETGTTVSFHVEAAGEVVSYRWEYRKIYKWFATTMEGYNTDTLYVPATGTRNGYDYRCEVTFADGTVVYTEPAELTVNTYITGVVSPNDQTVVLGYKGQFTAAAQGEGIKYQWQYKRPTGTTWINTAMEGCTKPTVLIETTTARDGYQYRCVITDVTGNVTVYTEPATMRVLSFKTHPQETFATAGTNATFTVTTSVDSGFTYQWQYSKDGVKWSNTTMTGYNTDTLTVAATVARNGYQYRCVIIGSKNSKLESKAATLHVSESVTVTRQPAPATAAVGETVSFTVVAANASAYQWQYQTATGTRWMNTGATGNKTATLRITATTGNNGYKYRCIVYGADGTELITDVATLTVG